jgi:hypothetical protein
MMSVNGAFFITKPRVHGNGITFHRSRQRGCVDLMSNHALDPRLKDQGETVVYHRHFSLCP